MQSKITKRTVDAATSHGQADSWLWDAELKGFGLRVRPNGRKAYVLEYRPGAGGRRSPKRRVTIGRHGSPWTPDTARTEARRLLGIVAAGGDPALDKSGRKGAPTIEDLAGRFMREHVRVKRKASTAAEYDRLIDLYVTPAMGARRVGDIERRDILKIHAGLSGTPYQANRTLAVISALFNFAELVGERAPHTNPAAGVEPYPERARERMLSPQELAWLGEAMLDAEAEAAAFTAYSEAASAAGRRLAAARKANDRKAGGAARRELTRLRASRPAPAIPPQALLCIRLLCFTGARLREILTLQWPWVSVDRGEARLPDSKTDRKTVYLPAPALDVLAKAPRFADNPYVIAGERPGHHFVGMQRPWRAIRNAATVKAWAASSDARVAALVSALRKEHGREPTFEECQQQARLAGVGLPVELSDLRLHDLRHAFASVAASSGMGLPIIGKMLGHSQPATTQRYAHLAPDPVRAAAATVAGAIAAGLAGRRGEVVDLERRGAG